jgi:hypothetical protein
MSQPISSPLALFYRAAIAERLEVELEREGGRHSCKFLTSRLGCPHFGIGAGDIQAVNATAAGPDWDTQD